MKCRRNKERRGFRKELFGEKEGEKMDMTKAIQTAIIEDDKDGERLTEQNGTQETVRKN